MNYLPYRAAAVVLSAITALSVAQAQDWKATLTSSSRGSFAALRSLRATYAFGWSGFTAASAEVRFSRNASNQSELDGKIRTVDFVKSLWSFEVDHAAVADVTSSRPIEVRQTESVRSKKIVTTLAFNAQGVTSTRSDGGKGGPKTKRVEMPDMFDLQTALLHVRSQTLAGGEQQRIIVFPGKDPYLATITAEGRDRVKVPAGSYNAIKLDLKLAKIGRNNELKPHKKFRKATVWLSDDADRMLLRAEAEVFVGTVFAELQSVEYEGAQVRRD